MNSKALSIQQNQDPQVATLKHTDIKPEALKSLPQRNPTAREILDGMHRATNPLDFIQRNLAPGSQPLDPNTLLKREEENRTKQVEVEQKAEQLQTKAPVEVPEASKQEVKPEATEEAKKPEETKADEKIEYDIDLREPVDVSPEAKKDPLDEELDLANANSAAENFKKLRTKAKEALKNLTQIQEEKKKLEEELSKYKTGEVVPEILQEKEARINQLQYYEKLHNLKMSPEYRDSFIKPLNELQTKLSEFAADYSIPPEELNKALNIQNRADLNRFLADHFDEVGALEVKQLINNVQAIREKAKIAEEQPAKALNDLHEEHQRIQESRRAETRNKIANKSRDAWAKAVFKIREEGKAQELIMKDTDPEYNDKVVKPVLTAASGEYGKIVTLLAERGLEDLDDELGYAIARMTLLAHASAVSIDSRQAAIQQMRELEQNSIRTASYVRPPVGGGVPAREASGLTFDLPPNATPQDAGKTLINTILSRK